MNSVFQKSFTISTFQQKCQLMKQSKNNTEDSRCEVVAADD